MKILKPITENKGFIKYFKNTSWVLFERVLRIFVGIFVTVWVARYLGPEQFGILSYAIAIVGLFSAFATLGLDSITVRELVKNETMQNQMIGTVFWLKLMGAISVLFFLYIFVSILPNDRNTNFIIFIIASSTIFQSFNVIDFYFQSKVLSRYVVYANIISLSLSSIIKILLILFESSLISFAWVVLFDSFILSIGLIYYYFLTNPLINIRFYKFSKDLAKSLLNDSWPLILSALLISVYMKIDQVMINSMLGSNAVGQYSAAVRLSEAWYFIPVVIAASLFPAVINAKQHNEIIYYTRLQQLYDFMVWTAILISIPVALYSDAIVNFLYGIEYSKTSNVLKIHIWTSVFVFLGVASSKWFVAENFMKLFFVRSLYGVLCNIAFNIILIPLYGIEGAAISTLFGQILVTYLSDLFSVKTRRNFIMKTKTLVISRYFKI